MCLHDLKTNRWSVWLGLAWLERKESRPLRELALGSWCLELELELEQELWLWLKTKMEMEVGDDKERHGKVVRH